MSDFGTGPEYGAAVCAAHPTRAAKANCTRCGAFMCVDCTEGGIKSTCAECRLRGDVEDGYPIERGSWSFDQVFSQAFERWKPEWLMISVGILAVGGIGAIAGIAGNVLQVAVAQAGSQAATVIATLLSMFVQYAVSGVLGLGFSIMLIDVAQGKPADLGKLFSQVSKLGKVLLQYMIIVGAMMVPMLLLFGLGAGIVYGAGLQHQQNAIMGIGGVALLLLMVPAVWAGLGVVFMQMELANDDQVGALESIKRSFALAKGQRLGIFGVSFVAGLIGMLGLLACGIGVLVSMGLTQLIMITLYLGLRNGSGLPAIQHDR